MTNKSTVNLMFDGVLALLFMILMAPGIPQTDLHRYVGMVLGIGIVVHLAMHRQWIGAMWRARGRPLVGQAHIDRILDLILLGLFSVACVSGVLMWSAGSGSATESIEATGSSELRSGDPSDGSAGRGPFSQSGRMGLRQGGDNERRLTPLDRSENGAFVWHVIHFLSAILATIALLTHLALHAKRVVSQIRKQIFGRSERPEVAG